MNVRDILYKCLKYINLLENTNFICILFYFIIVRNFIVKKIISLIVMIMMIWKSKKSIYDINYVILKEILH